MRGEKRRRELIHRRFVNVGDVVMLRRERGGFSQVTARNKETRPARFQTLSVIGLYLLSIPTYVPAVTK